MGRTAIVSAFITLLAMGTLARAEGNYMLLIGPYYSADKHSDDSRDETSSLRYRDFTVSTPQSRRLIKTGALILGIDWAMCTAAGIFMMAGDPANLQIAIPFYATAGWAAKSWKDSPGLGALLLFPTFVQTAGALLIIVGLVKRRHARKFIEVGVIPGVLPKGGAMGITVSM